MCILSGSKEIKKKVELMLDSGAFSAWSQKTTIDIDAYLKFALAHIDLIDYVVNLDVIPGWPGKKLTPKDREESAQKGWANYVYLKKKGIPKEKLIHVFHQGEDFKWLRRMIARDLGYIGVSPANDKTTAQKMQWLDECMNHVTDRKGFPIIKFHGFAVTSLRLMLRYPWYSVDSTSWVMTSRMGSILVPVRKNGKYIYDIDPHKVIVSAKSPKADIKGKHINSYPRSVRSVILDYVSEHGYSLGKSKFIKRSFDAELRSNERWAEKKKDSGKRLVEVVEEIGLCNTYQLRDEMNIIYFNDLEKNLVPWPNKPFKLRARSSYGLLS
jgi:hypothetical protein